MGYDLVPRNKKVKEFYFGAFSYPVLIEACGAYFPVIRTNENHGGWRWMPSKRMGGYEMPLLLTNDGFKITAAEAKVMARCARNYADLKEGQMREDFVEKLRIFADWAEKSSGFKVW